MIGINNFGWRLGNQLFQIAAAVALAKSNNDYVAFPKWDYAQYFAGDFTPIDFHGVYEYKEDGFHHKPIVYRKTLGLNGYFQSEKYFLDKKYTIRNMFQPTTEILHDIQHRYAMLVQDDDGYINVSTCSVHVRRGDYVNLPNHHPIISDGWYHAVMNMSHFSDDTHFLVFSDDHKWCKDNIGTPKNWYDQNHKITIVKGGTDVDDFFMQTMCDSHIIANSSYSWWAAWLHKDAKTVIAPSVWFGPAYDDWNTKDLIPDRWEIV